MIKPPFIHIREIKEERNKEAEAKAEREEEKEKRIIRQKGRK